MITFRNIAIAQALLWLVALLQNWVYWQRLPERVATHFDASGKADGWTGSLIGSISFHPT
jgi:uncharacterized membrane protein